MATAIAKLVASSGFPEPAARDLERLLGHELATEDTGSVRFARLGLLQSLIGPEGEFISSSYYEQVRKERRAHGEDWPAAATLIRVYGGHWIKVVRAAARFMFDGGSARVPSSHAHCGPQRSYRPQEIIEAIIRCRSELELGNAWPTQWEYEEWGRVKRQLAHKAGNPCRVPGPKQVRTAFGSFDNALKAAELHLATTRARE